MAKPRNFLSVFNSAMLRTQLVAFVAIGWTGDTHSAAADEAQNVAAFDQAVRVIAHNVYEYRLHTLDWDAVAAQYRPQAAAARNEAELSAAINRMLDEFGPSQIGHYTRADPLYYQIADIFGTAYEMHADASPFASAEVKYPSIGINSRTIDGKTFVTAVLDGLPADKAGLLRGDEIISVDGRPYRPMRSFQRLGQGTILTIRRTANGPEQHLAVTPESMNPQTMFFQAMTNSVRITREDAFQIGYVHVWSNGRYRYERLLQDLLLRNDLKAADALIVDLRSSLASVMPDMTEMFGQAPELVEVHLPNLRKPLVRKPSDGKLAWEKPVVLLVNEETRSGLEVLAHVLKGGGRGEVVGTSTAGILETFALKFLDDGSLLQYPVADIEIDGQRLIGGIEPTIEVPFDLRYAAGQDPQLERAIEVLVSTLGGNGGNSLRKAK